VLKDISFSVSTLMRRLTVVMARVQRRFHITSRARLIIISLLINNGRNIVFNEVISFASARVRSSKADRRRIERAFPRFFD
jgi:hypothetical protein